MTELVSTEVRIVPAVDRAARLLQVLSRNRHDWSLTELAHEIGIHKGTARDILLTMQRHGLVVRDGASGRFRLGLGAARFARAALDQIEVRNAARPTLARLMAETEQTALLGVRDEHHVIIADLVEPSHDFHLSTSVGRRVPLCAGAFGKAYLAESGALEEFIAEGGVLREFTAVSVKDVKSYARHLVHARDKGYALDDEEYLDGVRAAAALVRDQEGEPLAAVAVVGFKASISLSRLEELGQHCKDAANEITSRLGGATSF